MAPMVMECDVDGCQFATKELEPAVAVELLKLHIKNSHTQAMGGINHREEGPNWTTHLPGTET